MSARSSRAASRERRYPIPILALVCLLGGCRVMPPDCALVCAEIADWLRERKRPVCPDLCQERFELKERVRCPAADPAAQAGGEATSAAGARR